MEISFEGKHPSQYFDRRIRNASELKRLLPYRPVLMDELEKQIDLSATHANRCLYLHIPFLVRPATFVDITNVFANQSKPWLNMFTN